MGIFDFFHKKPKDIYNIQRFVNAQEEIYLIALSEVRAGMKQSHWIWYIFPQLKVLGRSYNAKFYGITDKVEAQAYIAHPLLNARLREITRALLVHDDKTAIEIFGNIDAKKVQSSMTLFDTVSPNDIFAQVLDKFYNGRRCMTTMNNL